MLSDECCCEIVLYDMELWIVEVEMDRVGHRRAEKTLKRRSGRAEGSGRKMVIGEDGDESI